MTPRAPRKDAIAHKRKNAPMADEPKIDFEAEGLLDGR